MNRRAIQRALVATLPWLLLIVGIWLVASQVSRPSFLVKAGDVKARVGCIAVIMTAIVISGGIDLSVGSMVALSSVVMASLWQVGLPPEVAGIAAVAVGVVAGAGNGGLVNFGLSPLVATLATMAFYRGLAVTLAGGQKINKFEVEPIFVADAFGLRGAAEPDLPYPDLWQRRCNRDYRACRDVELSTGSPFCRLAAAPAMACPFGRNRSDPVPIRSGRTFGFGNPCAYEPSMFG